MELMSPVYLLWAALLGGISAASLPLGAAAALLLRPRTTTSGLLAAFGAGALIAALALELVAPTAAALHEPGHGGEARAAFVALLAGAGAGGLLFVVLDRALAERGGFLRKISTAITWHTRRQGELHRDWLGELGAIPLLRALPVERVGELLRDVRPRVLSDGERLYAEGDPARFLVLVRAGEIEIRRGGERVEVLGTGGILGELPLLTGTEHAVTARALGTAEVLTLPREAFQRWRRECPEFDAGLRALASERLGEIRTRDAVRGRAEERWGRAALAALEQRAVVPDELALRRAAEEHESSGLAVWLGLLIDGIPESIVIGAGIMGMVAAQLDATGAVSLAGVVPYTLIAGLFLSNFPEALSSSVAMRAQGYGRARVLGLWLALAVLTALGAGVGYAIGGAVPHVALVGIEGLAAGAMLTTIASTMIPEAVHLSGAAPRAGLATLAGFLAAVAFELAG